MTQIVVKPPDALVRLLDELVAHDLFPSRSSAVRRAVEAIVSSQRRGALAQAYTDGYRGEPESESELAEAKRLAKQAIDDEPWTSGGREGRGLWSETSAEKGQRSWS